MKKTVSTMIIAIAIAGSSLVMVAPAHAFFGIPACVFSRTC